MLFAFSLPRRCISVHGTVARRARYAPSLQPKPSPRKGQCGKKRNILHKVSRAIRSVWKEEILPRTPAAQWRRCKVSDKCVKRHDALTVASSVFSPVGKQEASAMPRDLVGCPRCVYTSTSIKRVVNHMVKHSCETNFRVVCGIGGCAASFRLYNLYRTHVYRKNNAAMATVLT